MKSKILTVIAIVAWMIYFFLPYKQVWLSDVAINGKKDCGGHCVETDNHFTKAKISRFGALMHRGQFYDYNKDFYEQFYRK